MPYSERQICETSFADYALLKPVTVLLVSLLRKSCGPRFVECEELNRSR